jgi:NADH dehydrogenase/NADH:ubiquinone oxidoreductase subunit G
MFSSEHDRREAGTWDESRQTVTDTICPYCGVGCTLSLHVQDNQIVKVTSPFDVSVTYGNLCIKGRFGWQYVQNRRGDGSGKRSNGVPRRPQDVAAVTDGAGKPHGTGRNGGVAGDGDGKETERETGRTTETSE